MGRAWDGPIEEVWVWCLGGDELEDGDHVEHLQGDMVGAVR